MRVGFEGYVTAGGNSLAPEVLGGGLQVLPSVLLRGPSKDSSVLIQGKVRQLLLVECGDLLYLFWVKIGELYGRSGLRIDHSLRKQEAHVKHFLPVRCLAAAGGEADASSEDRKSTRLNSSHLRTSRMPSSA